MSTLNFSEIGLNEIRDSERIIIDLPKGTEVESSILSVKNFIASLSESFGLECTSVVVDPENNMPERLFISRIEQDKHIPADNFQAMLNSFQNKVSSELGATILFGYGKALPGSKHIA